MTGQLWSLLSFLLLTIYVFALQGDNGDIYNIDYGGWEEPNSMLLSFGGEKYINFQGNNLQRSQELSSLKGSSVCSGENYTICFTDLINYIKLGQDDIKLTNNTDAIIIVGSSGVGKSTLVQFIANDTNILEAVCSGGTTCNITDDSGSIGGTIISQTFVPNLVIDNTTDTPFYDMPGFNDNRNETVEIANSFFIKRVLENAQRVKIVVVVRKTDLTITYRDQFKNILESLCKLVKNPFKFKHGIAVVVNMADYYYPNDAHFYDYFEFMEGVNNVLPSLVKPEYLTASEELMKIFMEQPNTCTYSIPVNVGIMRKPVTNGSIRHDEKFLIDYQDLRQLIHNSTEYIEKDDNDFGFAISSDSELFIIQAFESIGLTIIDLLGQLADKIIETSASQLKNWADTCSVNNRFPQQLNNLVTASYEYINETNVPPSYYINCTWEKVGTFAHVDEINPYKEQLDTPFVFLDYIQMAMPELQLRQHVWISPLNAIQSELKEHADTKEALETVRNGVRQIFVDMGNDIADRFSVGFDNLAQSGSTNSTFQTYLNNLLTASYEFLNDTDKEPSYYRNNIWNVVSTFTDNEVISLYESKLESKFEFFDAIFQLMPEVELGKHAWKEALTGIKSRIIENSKTQNALIALVENFETSFENMTEKYSLQAVLERNSLPDIFEKYYELELLANISTELDSNLTSIRNACNNLSEYLRTVSDIYGQLTHTTIPNNIDYQRLEMLEDFFEQNLHWKDIEWGIIHTNYFKALIDDENKFTNSLLKNLQKDLGSVQVQSEREGNFHLWWNSMLGSVTESSMQAFWNKALQQNFVFCNYYTWNSFWAALNTRYTELERQKRIANLLNVTLLFQPVCLPITNSTILYIGNNISVRNLPNCTASRVDNVVLLATDTIFLDTNITGGNYNNISNINLVAIAPTLHVKEGNLKINLEGVNGISYGTNPGPEGRDGRNGTPGTPAGNFYGIFSETFGDLNASSFLLNGGIGGSGEDGSGGRNGNDGQDPEFNARLSNHCSCDVFRSFFYVRVTPNNCEQLNCDRPQGCQCYIGEWAEIYGTPASSGTNGGNGGDGKPGGKEGQGVIVKLNEIIPNIYTGIRGQNGHGGRKGLRGLGGKSGRHLRVLLNYDKLDSFFGYVCRELERSWVQNGKASDGTNGLEGRVGEGTNESSRIPIEYLVNEHLNLLRQHIETILPNEFLYRKLMKFK